MSKKINIFFEHFFQWVGKHNWYVIGAITLGMTLFEIFEVIRKRDIPTDPFHIVELVVYVFILILVGVLVDFLVRANAAQIQIMEILKHKHDVSLSLTKLEDWDELTDELVRIPSTVAALEGSRLFVLNSNSGEVEEIVYWNEEGTDTFDFYHDCLTCLQQRSESKSLFSSCRSNSTASNEQNRSQEFCLQLRYANSLLALIQFKLKVGEELSQKQKEIFEDIIPEMTLALKASQERKKLAEMQFAETALAERHSISTYLHDNLSQNLAYLCLKLDQYTTSEEPFSVENGQVDFQHMKDAANQSYDIVRKMIETIHPETTPCLANLFNEHAKKVSERAYVEISIENKGKELPVLADIQRAIFYVFREALSNIEKHARARSVKVLLDWGADFLDVVISDDGVGFDLQSLNGDKHFGLEIMQERVEKVGGQIDIFSSIGSGTEIKISVPIVSIQKERPR